MRRSPLYSAVLVISVLVVGLGATAAPALAKGRPTADRTAPTVTISTPTTGASVSSPFSVAGSAADNKGLTKVTVSVDAGTPTNATGTSSWIWTSSQIAPGSHTIKATAYDTSANITSTTVTVTVPAPADTTAPSIAISSPVPSSSVSGPLQVSGTASDNTSLASVSLTVDGGAAVPASGTTSWSAGLDATPWSAGTHVIVARVLDTAGNASTASVAVTKAAATGTTAGADITLNDPAATHTLGLLGRGRMAQLGTLTALVYGEQFTTRYSVFLRNSATGASSYVGLSNGTSDGWANPTAVLTTANDLWVAGGSGPIYLRHYQLSGSAVPTTATLLSTQVLGDTDSRSGDLIALRSGGLVVVWHQQEASGPRGLYVGYLSPSGAWQVLPALTFMPSNASKQIAVQHPVDDSVWVFSNPDAWAATGAVHLTEGPTGLTVDWTNGSYLSKSVLNELGPEGENPDLAAAPNPNAGTIDLAYEAANPHYFSTNPVVKGAYVNVVHIPATGPVSFFVLPTYVERISGLALSVVGSDTWLSYRPVNPDTLTWDQLYVSHAAGGGWEPAVRLGQLASPYQTLTYTSGAPLVGSRMADGSLHLYTVT